MAYELAFLKALLFTVSLEIIAAAALRSIAGRRLAFVASSSNRKQTKALSFVRMSIMVALASILTLPYVWFLLPAFVPRGLAYTVTAEVSVTVIEALWYFFCLRPFTAAFDPAAQNPSAKDAPSAQNRATQNTAASLTPAQNTAAQKNASKANTAASSSAAFTTAVILSAVCNAFSYLVGNVVL